MIINNSDAPHADSEELKAAPPVPMKANREQQEADTLPPPPPYSPAAGSSHLNGPRPPTLPARAVSTATSVFRPENPQVVNHFELFSKHDTISGTYLVDPLLPSAVGSISKKLRRRRATVWGKSSRSAEINTAFRTRHGAINVDMAIVSQSANTGMFLGAKVPARVLISTRHGKINVDMHEVHPGRSLDIQVESRHGKIVLLLPPTFDGPIVFETRSHNAVHLLPAFAARTRTLRASDRETVVLCSAPAGPSPAPHPRPLKPLNQMADDDGDRCLVRTRHGHVVVGVSGLDRVEEAAGGGGLFKSIGRLLEAQGKAFGQYVETQAKMLERNLTEKSGAWAQYVDARAQKGGLGLGLPVGMAHAQGQGLGQPSPLASGHRHPGAT